MYLVFLTRCISKLKATETDRAPGGLRSRRQKSYHDREERRADRSRLCVDEVFLRLHQGGRVGAQPGGTAGARGRGTPISHDFFSRGGAEKEWGITTTGIVRFITMATMY